MSSNRYPMPFTRIELAVFALAEEKLCALLARRREPPAQGKWALPGGVLRIDLDADLPAGAQRVAGERLLTHVPQLQLLTAVGGSARDPRAPWSLSIVFRGEVQAQDLALSPGKRIEELTWTPIDADSTRQLAFDHSQILALASSVLRSRTEALDLPWGLFAEEFTLGELQRVCEVVLGRPLDKSSFRRRLAESNCVEPVEGLWKGAAHRPAQVYRRRMHPKQTGG